MSHNTWIHRMMRPAARPPKDTPARPNQITRLRLGVGAAAALAIADGRALWLSWGAGLYLFGFYMAFSFRRGIARSWA